MKLICKKRGILNPNKNKILTPLFLFLISFSIFFSIFISIPLTNAELNIKFEESDIGFNKNVTISSVNTGFVPYTGAVTNVDLGIYSITADWFYGKINWSNIQNVPISNLTNTMKNASSPYLYNDTMTIYFNGTKANDTWVPYVGATRNVNLSSYNISAYAGNFTEIYVSNNSIYIGNVTLTSRMEGNKTYLDIPGVYLNTTAYIGDGGFLSNISFEGGNLSTNGSINANWFYGGIYNGSNFTGDWFFGKINWSNIQNVPASFISKNASKPYLYNTISTIFFNDTLLNVTIKDLAEVNAHIEEILVNVSGGSGSNTSLTYIDFLITEVIVVPPAGTKYRFQAAECNTGYIIDRNRMWHWGTWDIRKNHAIVNDTIQANITGAISDGIYNITIKYLDNFRP